MGSERLAGSMEGLEGGPGLFLAPKTPVNLAPSLQPLPSLGQTYSDPAAVNVTPVNVGSSMWDRENVGGHEGPGG